MLDVQQVLNRASTLDPRFKKLPYTSELNRCFCQITKCVGVLTSQLKIEYLLGAAVSFSCLVDESKTKHYVLWEDSKSTHCRRTTFDKRVNCESLRRNTDLCGRSGGKKYKPALRPNAWTSLSRKQFRKSFEDPSATKRWLTVAP